MIAGYGCGICVENAGKSGTFESAVDVEQHIKDVHVTSIAKLLQNKQPDDRPRVKCYCPTATPPSDACGENCDINDQEAK